jgi:hypothetical protein
MDDALCPLDVCDGDCIDMQTHPLHCGACFNECGADEVCVAGSCVPWADSHGCAACPCPACDGGFDECCDFPGDGALICVDAPACP